MDRRGFSATLAALAGALAVPAGARADASRGALPVRIAATWRVPGTDPAFQAGIVDLDWTRPQARIAARVSLPGRAHGLLADGDGGFLVASYRHGTWLWRLDADARPTRRITLADEPGRRRFAGHVAFDAGRQTLLTTEFEPGTGEGWIGVRDPQSLRKLDEWPTGGKDPHQVLPGPGATLLVANGGVVRLPDDRKWELERMDSSLSQLDARSGARVGQWRLDDRRVSLRHMAWSDVSNGDHPLLGMALQGEHDDPALRARTPVLAVWDGARIELPSAVADGAGYAGDIAPAAGGFVVSCQSAGCALWWRVDRPAELIPVAQLKDACALAPSSDGSAGVLVAGARGVGRWRPGLPGAMLAWPEPVVMDNHWITLDAG